VGLGPFRYSVRCRAQSGRGHRHRHHYGDNFCLDGDNPLPRPPHRHHGHSHDHGHDHGTRPGSDCSAALVSATIAAAASAAVSAAVSVTVPAACPTANVNANANAAADSSSSSGADGSSFSFFALPTWAKWHVIAAFTVLWTWGCFLDLTVRASVCVCFKLLFSAQFMARFAATWKFFWTWTPATADPPNSDDTADPEHGRTAPKKEEGESKKDDKLPSPVPSSKKRLRASSSV